MATENRQINPVRPPYDIVLLFRSLELPLVHGHTSRPLPTPDSPLCVRVHCLVPNGCPTPHCQLDRLLERHVRPGAFGADRRIVLYCCAGKTIAGRGSPEPSPVVRVPIVEVDKYRRPRGEVISLKTDSDSDASPEMPFTEMMMGSASTRATETEATSTLTNEMEKEPDERMVLSIGSDGSPKLVSVSGTRVNTATQAQSPRF